MRVFCPNCGTQNESPDVFPPGAPARITCTACTASFEVPRGRGEGSAPGASGLVPPRVPGTSPLPPPPGYAPPQSSAPGSGWLGGVPESRPLAAPQPFAGQPGVSTFGNPGAVRKGTNPLAIASLVTGILPCLPFGSIIAIVTGLVALKQIDASHGEQGGRGLAIAGIAIGSILTVLGVLAAILGLLFQ